MNKDQIKGATVDIVGKVQETVGVVTGDVNQQLKGLNKQVFGKAQKLRGDIEEIIKNEDS